MIILGADYTDYSSNSALLLPGGGGELSYFYL